MRGHADGGGAMKLSRLVSSTPPPRVRRAQHCCHLRLIYRRWYRLRCCWWRWRAPAAVEARASGATPGTGTCLDARAIFTRGSADTDLRGGEKAMPDEKE
ncbi:hypothetical protein GUJ93_ZPchr0001g32908 [Zizania palustris]|uniref:Uncharacterized protein n=1 Tax=Zizania palustris TaxID=103762 RepID=A0A8J5RN63_ZIZPA|nr:hypothetical protein GUJ93_ZPchr0001g32908 [Zizania palustris]